MQIIDIPLDKLDVHPNNARKRCEGIEQLGNSIITVGLLNPLTVSKGKDKKYLVHAGQRRLLALQYNADIHPDVKPAPVPCHVVETNAELISLTENVERLPITPVEEFKAFVTLSESLAIDEIASIFGITEHRVNQRLKLGNLDPSILKDYENGKVRLGYTEALCLTTDHKRQRQLRKEYPEDWHSVIIRRILTEKKFRRKAASFNVADYKGSLTVDLFSELEDTSDIWFDDLDQALKLQSKAAEAIVKDLLDDGWKWVEFHSNQLGYELLRKLECLYPETPRVDGHGKAHLYTKKEKAKTGVLISYGDDYKLIVGKGYLSSKDSKEHRKARSRDQKSTIEIADIEPGSTETYSNAFKADLDHMATTGAIYASIDKHNLIKRIALATIIAEMSWTQLKSAMNISLTHHKPSGWATGQLDKSGLYHNVETFMKNVQDVLDLYISKDTTRNRNRTIEEIFVDLCDTKRFSARRIDDTLVLMMALSLTTNNNLSPMIYRQIMDETKLDWRNDWTPNKAFFERMSKPQCRKILEELDTPEQIINAQMKLKRGDLLDRMTIIFKQPADAAKLIGISAHKEWIKAINGWVPESLRPIQNPGVSNAE